ncbi:MAG: M56 family metallopeptidase [Actinomycetota bacterium]|nr:M56 family metallopeptidase [Actinomycetota bacterium]
MISAGVSATRFYRFSLAVGSAGVLTLLAALAVVQRAVAPALPTFDEFADACQRLLLFTSAPAILVTALASLGVASGFRGARAVVRHHRSQRRLRRRLHVLDRVRSGSVSAEVFADSRPQAFCIGLLRPRIYLSSGAVSALDRSEFDAVLAHESHHATRRDPLRVLLSTVLRDALFFLPIMRSVADRYMAMAEMAADEAAVRHCAGSAPCWPPAW